MQRIIHDRSWQVPWWLETFTHMVRRDRYSDASESMINVRENDVRQIDPAFRRPCPHVQQMGDIFLVKEEIAPSDGRGESP